MRVFSIIVQKTYGFSRHCETFFRNSSLGKMVPSSLHKKFLAWKKRFANLISLFGFSCTMSLLSKEKNLIFQKNGFRFQLGKKWFSNLMRIPSGIFRHCKIDEFLTIVSFWIFTLLFCTLNGAPILAVPGLLIFVPTKVPFYLKLFLVGTLYF